MKTLIKRLSNFFASCLGRDIDENKFLYRLGLIDKTDPKKRAVNSNDLWFRRNYKHVHLFNSALDCLNYYGHLCDTYFSLAKDIQDNIDFQMKIISTHQNHWDVVVLDYSNLLCKYLRLKDFHPDIKKMVFSDEKKYSEVISVYNIIRR